MGGHYEFSLTLSVDDEAALLAAARAHEDAEGMDERDFQNDDGSVDISACLRMLLDPGSLDGCTIFDSSAEGQA